MTGRGAAWWWCSPTVAPPVGRTRWAARGRRRPGWSPRVRPRSWWTAKHRMCDWVWPSSWPASGCACGAAGAAAGRQPHRRGAHRRLSLGPHEVGRVRMPQGQPADRPRRRADHPRPSQRSAARGAHRRGQGQVDRGVRHGVAGMEPGLFDRGVPVRQERQVEGRRGGRVPRARPAARRARSRWPRRMAQDGRGLVVVAQARQRGRPRRRRGRRLGGDQPAGWPRSVTTSTCSTSSPIR